MNLNGFLRRAVLISALVCVQIAVAKSELNLFAWSEYVPQAVIDGFSRETGIKVNYETFASNEEMLSKLMAGASSYDLIQPSDYVAESLIKGKLLAPLDFSKIPNFKNILPEYVKMEHDPEQKYTVPYMTGTICIVVNTDKVKEPVTGFVDLFQPKFANRIVVVNDNRELVTWALYTLGLGTNDFTPQTLARTKPILAEWVKRIKVYDSDSPKTAFLSGDVDLGVVWSGEAAQLYQENKKFRFILPKEGFHRFIDLLAIPKDAKNKDAAQRFIDYILRPEVSKLISDAFPYTNPNGAARKLLTQEQLDNPASYPQLQKAGTLRPIGRISEEIDALVTDLKNSR